MVCAVDVDTFVLVGTSSGREFGFIGSSGLTRFIWVDRETALLGACRAC